jgi:hypothetical protein
VSTYLYMASILCGVENMNNLDQDPNASPEDVFHRHCQSLAQVGLFRGLSYLLLCNYEMFVRFRCFENEAALSCDQLRRVAALLAHPTMGLATIMRATGQYVPRHMVSQYFVLYLEMQVKPLTI